jgi:hypothetical protein
MAGGDWGRLLQGSLPAMVREASAMRFWKRLGSTGEGEPQRATRECAELAVICKLRGRPQEGPCRSLPQSPPAINNRKKIYPVG